LNDAIDDNMDVINLSFGAIGTVGASSDILAEAAQRAAWRGVIIVMAAGNDGPDPMTVDDTAALQDVIAVGASQSDFVFADPAVLLTDGTGYPAGITTNSYNTEPQTAELADVETLESNAPEGQKGLGCTKLPDGSLNGKIALIRRGECFFYEKLRNARDAGAISGIIYNRPDADPNELIDMDVSDGPSIPGVFVRNGDGVALRTALLEKKTLTVTLQYLLAVGNPNSLAEFSSVGPSVDLLIKPDLMAVGAPLLTATQTSFPAGNLSDPSGYVRLNGTSFSAPLVAGAAAVVRAARPGLLAEDYRSLLVNSAAPMKNSEGNDLPVQSTGAGLLDMGRAINSTIAAFPVSLAFGATSSTIDAWKQFTVRNLGTEAATYELSVESTNDLKPTLSESRVTLSPGDRAWILALFNNAGVTAGAYQGFIRVRQEGKDIDARIPYWLAVRSDEPAQVAFVEQPFSGAPGSTVRVLFRVFDASGLPMTTPEPRISVVSGAGEVVSLSPSTSLPNIWVGRVKLGASDRINGFKIEAGTISRTFEVLGAL
jgi:subtilisin family serine protease